MPNVVLICQDVASCPAAPVASMRGKCGDCGRAVWVSFGGAQLETARTRCIPCMASGIRSNGDRVVLPFTPGLGNDMAGLCRQVVTWLREHRGRINLAGIIGGRQVGSDFLEHVGAHCGRTGDFVSAQIVLTLAAFTEPDRAEIVREARG